MLLPVADVIATCSRLMLLPWWLMLYPPMGDVADVIAMVACWNGHRVTLILIQMLYFKEHQKAPSPIFDHCNTSGHKVTINNFTIVGREDQNLTRAIKEALFIRVNDPSLNRSIGKYHLPHIWDEVLHTTSELKLK